MGIFSIEGLGDLSRGFTPIASPSLLSTDDTQQARQSLPPLNLQGTKCPENTFSEELNADTCKECPVNTTTGKDGSTSMWDCKCEASCGLGFISNIAGCNYRNQLHVRIMRLYGMMVRLLKASHGQPLNPFPYPPEDPGHLQTRPESFTP